MTLKPYVFQVIFFRAAKVPLAINDLCGAGELPIHDPSKHVVELRNPYIVPSIPIQNRIEA